MVIVDFLVKNKVGKRRFFQDIFMLMNTSMEAILNILFVTFQGVHILFPDWKLAWKDLHNYKDHTLNQGNENLVQKRICGRGFWKS